jgi:sortase A
MSYKTLNIIFVFIIGLLLFWHNTGSEGSIHIAEISPTLTATPTSTPTPTPTPSPTPPFPSRLIIPKLNIDALVEATGNNADGTMALPVDPVKVGWYINSAKPGETGNAVIGGHLDLVTGAQAIFYYLSNLTVGDEFIVYDIYDTERKFRVVDKQIYPYNETPIDLVLGKSQRKMLNLITCTGWFNQNAHNYSHRLVVFSELVEK